MRCKNCYQELENGIIICPNCGTSNEIISDSNISKEKNINKRSNINSLLLFIIGFLIVLLIGIGIYYIIKINKNDNTSQIVDKSIDEDSEKDDTPIETDNNKVKGTYSNEIFSNHTFEYNDMDTMATFTFNLDSTFIVTYSEGTTYTGTYEVYNGLNITAKAESIRNDSTINSSDRLATGIINVSNSMMYDNNNEDLASSIIHTYLLWLKTDDGILQPHLVKYNPDTTVGVAVNVYATEQGQFKLKY